MPSKVPVEKRYCHDCHFSRNKSVDVSTYLCVSPENVCKTLAGEVIIDRVTGSPAVRVEPCYKVRRLALLCGPDARWFLTTAEYLSQVKPSLSPSNSASTPKKSIGVDDI